MTLNENSLRPDQIRRNFSRHAAEYERYALVQKRVAESLVAEIGDLSNARSVLEVGCGTGVLSRRLLKSEPELNLLLSDIAHGMSCTVAAEYPWLGVVDADAANLPFANAHFDLVCSSSVYQWVDHLPQAFAELHRILRPGGRIALALFGDRTLYELRQSHAVALESGRSHTQGFPDTDQVSRALSRLFRVTTLESALEVEWHADVPDLLRSLKAIGAQNASREKPAGLRSRQTMQRMFDCYRQTFAREGRIPATYEVIYLVAEKS